MERYRFVGRCIGVRGWVALAALLIAAPWLAPAPLAAH